jgi:hypothetical protein
MWLLRPTAMTAGKQQVWRLVTMLFKSRLAGAVCTLTIRGLGVCLKNLKQVDTDLREDVLDERKQAIAATTVEVGTTVNNQFKF